MNKKDYSSPEVEFVSFKLCGDILGASTYTPTAENPTRSGDEGFDDEW